MNKAVRTLEDQFFYDQEQKLREKLDALRRMKETKESLRDVSGIQDDHLLQKLVELDVRPETIASLAIVPLVEVAWASGEVDDRERGAVLDAVRRFDGANGSIDLMLVNYWLEHKPEPSLLQAWKEHLGHLCGRMTADEVNGLKAEIMDHAFAVARASGGILGVGKISREEKEMLGTIEQAFSPELK